MSWFLVLLFWNPAIQEYVVADGWHPMPYATHSICEERSDFVKRYTPPREEVIVDCIQAKNEETAIAIAKG